MDWCCLLVDLTNSDLAETWQAKTANLQFGIQLSFAKGDDATINMETGGVATLAVFATEFNEKLRAVLSSYKNNVGAIGSFQAIVCSDPSPEFMNEVFEFGIEQFIALETWPQDLSALSRDWAEVLNSPNSAEANAVKLSLAIKKSDKKTINEIQSNLNETAEHDFLAAYSRGKALEASGDFNAAVQAFESSSKMNKFFRPSTSSLGENLMVTGQIDKAIDVFSKLDKLNPTNADRKATLAAAYVEKGDFAKANELLEAAKKINPELPKIKEAKAQLLLSSGNVGDAFKLMDQMSDVGPFFAAKLNEMGIKLSQAGKGKSALALYQKAHKIVRPELKHKISMNAALACHRMSEFAMALKYLDRCEKEAGESFEKLEKIRRAVKAALVKQQQELEKKAS